MKSLQKSIITVLPEHMFFKEIYFDYTIIKNKNELVWHNF